MDQLPLPIAKMRSLVVLFTALTVCSARPQFLESLHVSPVRSVDSYIYGGTDANPGDFPWQLSLTYGGSHICGATLLGPTHALCAASCVNGAPTFGLQVIAGLYNRSDLTGTQSSDVSNYTVHELYNLGTATYSNDIAILYFSGVISIGGNIQVATLPTNNNNDYVGYTCQISGWGSTDPTNDLSNILQKAFIPVITTAQCYEAVGGIAVVWDNQICAEDPASNAGACSGDNGGPLNCPDLGVNRVVGVASWILVSGTSGDCLPQYPSVYTRVGAYLQWISDNSP